jgi:hypothetical protein
LSNVPSGGAEKTLARLAHMKKLRADFVTSISENLEEKVKGLMLDIPILRNIVLNENTHEIWVIEQILLTRNNRNDDFCIKLVHAVLERNCLILNGRYFSDWVTQVSLFFYEHNLTFIT